MAHKKSGGSSSNGRDTIGKRLGLKALPIELPIPPRPVGVVTLKTRTLSPLAQLFIDCARNLSKPLAAMSTVRKR